MGAMSMGLSFATREAFTYDKKESIKQSISFI